MKENGMPQALSSCLLENGVAQDTIKQLEMQRIFTEGQIAALSPEEFAEMQIPIGDRAILRKLCPSQEVVSSGPADRVIQKVTQALSAVTPISMLTSKQRFKRFNAGDRDNELLGYLNAEIDCLFPGCSHRLHCVIIPVRHGVKIVNIEDTLFLFDFCRRNGYVPNDWGDISSVTFLSLYEGERFANPLSGIELTPQHPWLQIALEKRVLVVYAVKAGLIDPAKVDETILISELQNSATPLNPTRWNPILRKWNDILQSKSLADQKIVLSAYQNLYVQVFVSPAEIRRAKELGYNARNASRGSR